MGRHISNDLRAHIPILFYEHGLKVTRICKLLKLKKSFVYKVLDEERTYGVPYNPHARRVGRPRILTIPNTKYIFNTLSRHRTMYLSEIQEQLDQQCDINVSLTTIFNTLRRLYFSHKSVSAEALERNQLERSAFMNTMADLVLNPDQLMFTDEALRNQRTQQRQFRLQVLPALKAGATDIDKLADYTRLVSKISTSAPDKPIIVFIDKQDIKKKKLPKRASQDDDEGSQQDKATDEDKSGSDDDGNELSLMDCELARLRSLLEAKYKSDHDNSYAYMDPVSGDLWPLTPFMLKEWCCAMYDGKATVSEPPQMPTFDAVNRLPSIRNDHRRHSISSSSSSAPTSDIGHLANIITTLQAPPTTPQKPAITHALHPFLNTPSKLPCFLAFVEKEFHVKDVMTYHFALEGQRIGPDVLQSISDDMLMGLNIPIGDIRRLKEAAAMWIQSDDAKKRGAPEGGDQEPVDGTKCIRFEKRWKDGSGTATYHGTSVDASSPGPEMDYEWYYYCDSLQKMMLLQPGDVPVLDEEF
ncbi:hypothetical protein D9758_016254 [Tetrapyrgos nigripes]|uniref:Uncharacterized protein n=1 Tax=Tetrapyrgos nigripes TaxID=182062 RepID=A0A8H5BYS7_9AGAR|nr:hypothetical protein D9758_016254 [Tetrapyrgos nigripes]